MLKFIRRRNYRALNHFNAYACLSTWITVAACPIYAVGADIRPHIVGNGSYRAIVIEGNIAPGDFATFIRIVRENQGQVSGVYCFSPGGDFDEAMKIGRAMRALELSSHAPMRDPSGRPSCTGSSSGVIPNPNAPENCTCASAGFFIHVGAVHRGGTFLAVHRPYTEKGKIDTIRLSEAKKAFDHLQESAKQYMTEMGVPMHIQDDVLGTPSDQMLVLDGKTVKTYFWGPLSYLEEWTRNRCGRLWESEKDRYENYSRRFLNAGSETVALSRTESIDFDGIRRRKDEQFKCELSLDKKRRIDAYERYFGRSIDSTYHNFEKWSEAAKYLGKHFYELTSEQKFDEDKFINQSSLRRSATATSPDIQLFDSESKPRVVTSIGVISPPNPSPEFVQSLVNSLEKAWGMCSGGNGTTNWRWNTNEFTANLESIPKSSEGPYLLLNIDEK
jgi:hypothetical protein